MHGNVWEWCRDWHAMTLAGGTNPQGLKSGSYRVSRGGSWDGLARRCRSDFRNWFDPRQQWYDMGFRVAVVPSGK